MRGRWRIGSIAAHARASTHVLRRRPEQVAAECLLPQLTNHDPDYGRGEKKSMRDAIVQRNPRHGKEMLVGSFFAVDSDRDAAKCAQGRERISR